MIMIYYYSLFLWIFLKYSGENVLRQLKSIDINWRQLTFIDVICIFHLGWRQLTFIDDNWLDALDMMFFDAHDVFWCFLNSFDVYWRFLKFQKNLEKFLTKIDDNLKPRHLTSIIVSQSHLTSTNTNWRQMTSDLIIFDAFWCFVDVYSIVKI